VGEFHPRCRKLRASKFRPTHGELGRRSARCVRAGSTQASVSCTPRAPSRLRVSRAGGVQDVRRWRLVNASCARAKLRCGDFFPEKVRWKAF
jgi:hypothetical protein